MCSMQHVCCPNKSWSSNHELTAGVSAAVSVSRGQQPSFWLRPLPASYKHMQNSQQHVAVVSILPGLPEFSHGINFAMEVEMFGEPKGLIPLLSLGTNCLWSCRQVSSSAVHTGDTSDDAHVSGLDCCTMAAGYASTDVQEIPRDLCRCWGGLWATLPALIIFNSRLKPFPRIDNFPVFKRYKRQLCRWLSAKEFSFSW